MAHNLIPIRENLISNPTNCIADIDIEVNDISTSNSI